MRRFISCAGAASLTTIAALVIGLGVSACGSSTGTTTSTESVPRPSGMPQRGGMNGDPSAMLGSRLDPLVEDGTISASQQESIVAALKGAMTGARPSAMPTGSAQSQGSGQPPDMSTMFSSALDPLVEDGTITGAQEESVIAALSTPPEGAPAGLQ